VPVLTDAAGHELQAASDAVLPAWEALLDDYAAFRPTVPEHLKALLEADPEMPMAQVARSVLLTLAGRGELVSAARGAAAEAQRCSDDASAREQLHAAAAMHFARGNTRSALRAWGAILEDAPTDLLAAKLTQFALFYAGDPAAHRRALDALAPAWGEGVPRRSFFLGMRAFAHEESGDLDSAEALGRAAVEAAPQDAWAVHAVTHVLETRGDAEAGMAWIDDTAAGWSGAGTMDGHLRWHRALLALECRPPAEVLADLDAGQHPADSVEYLDLCNDIALLQRLELRGLVAGERWTAIAAAVDARRQDGLMPFCDVHWVLALCAAGRYDAADAVIESMVERAAAGGDDAEALRRAAIPIARGLRAWRRGNADDAFAQLDACRDDQVLIGGSHAQRDLLDQVRLAAARACGAGDALDAGLAARRGRRPDDAFARALGG
jgi:hypothetical protein